MAPFTQTNVPVPVSGGLTFLSVSAGGDHSCGITIAGAVYCWGLNQHGELGNGTTDDSNVPVPIYGIFPPDTQGPLTTGVTASPNPVAVGGTVDLTANVDDTGRGDAAIVSAEYNLDGGAFLSMVASDGVFDGISEFVNASFSAPTGAGTYDLCVRGTDDVGNLGDPVCTSLVVFLPTPNEQIEDLGAAVQALFDTGVLTAREAQDLTGKLDGATDKLDQGTPDKAIKKLMDFIREVNKLQRKGVLTVAEAGDLVDAAQGAIDTIQNGS